MSGDTVNLSMEDESLIVLCCDYYTPYTSFDFCINFIIICTI